MTTAEIVQAKTQFEIERGDWFEILDTALIFVSNDPYVPMIASVQLRVTPVGVITASATDRFALGRRTYELPMGDRQGGFGDAVELLIPAAEVRTMRRIHMSAAGIRGVPNPVVVEVTSRSLGPVVERGSITVRSRNGAVVSTHDGLDIPDKFVDLDQLLERKVDEPLSELRWSPQLMAKFAKVKGHGSPAEVRFQGPMRPMLINIGDHFAGAIMPVRGVS